MDWTKERLKEDCVVDMPDVTRGNASGSVPRNHRTVPRDADKLTKRSNWFQLQTSDASAAEAEYSVASGFYNARPSIPSQRISNGAFESFMRRHLDSG